MSTPIAIPPAVLPGAPGAPLLVLASASRTRAALLQAAGLAFHQEAAAIDEGEVKRAMRAEGADAAAAATALAVLKAERVSRRHPGALVLGADQILECGGTWFDKPPDADHARAQIVALRGRTHGLATAAVLLRDGTRIWHHVATPRLRMRVFSDAFLDSYLEAVGPAALDSVGGYQLEGPGVQLFDAVEGDSFAVLGLPLLPLLDILRGHGVARR